VYGVARRIAEHFELNVTQTAPTSEGHPVFQFI
jgi:hypothetical protein